jgi:DNA-binding NtrC family response regulator
MMHEQVCIVLNERESSKAKAAETLSAKLSERNITSSRLPIDNRIQEKILARRPRVLVLDYLLGDVSTGLDVLSAVSDLEESKRPLVFFWTDEPSVPVAVDAMRLGAQNYFELDNPQSVDHLAREIQALLRNLAMPVKTSTRVIPALDDLIAGSKTSATMVTNARTIALKHAPVTIIAGPAGSGRTTLAEAMHLERASTSILKIVDLNIFDDKFETLLVNPDNRTQVGLGSNLTVIIENPEEDDGRLIEFISQYSTKLWPTGSGQKVNSYLFICASDPMLIRSLQRIKLIETVQIPSLAERRDDIAALVQRFVREAIDLSGEKIKPFSAEAVQWLGKQDWPGQIRQLRSVVIDAAIASTFDEREVKELLQERFELDSQHSAQPAVPISPLSAAIALEISGGNYRIAGARLGCSVRHLYSLVKSEGIVKERN